MKNAKTTGNNIAKDNPSAAPKKIDGRGRSPGSRAHQLTNAQRAKGRAHEHEQGSAWYSGNTAKSLRAALRKMDGETLAIARKVASNESSPIALRKAALANMRAFSETDAKKFAETLAILENQANGAPAQKIEQTNIELPAPILGAFTDDAPGEKHAEKPAKKEAKK